MKNPVFLGICDKNLFFFLSEFRVWGLLETDLV